MKIVTCVVNNPLFIKIQYHSFKKFINFDYEFIVFNNTYLFEDYTNEGDLQIKQKIKDMCISLNIQCIDIPSNDYFKYISPSDRHAFAMNYIFKYMCDNKDEYLAIDSDMFLVDNLHKDRYKNNDIGIVLQHRKTGDIDHNYMWPNLFYFNLFKLKNLHLINFNVSHNCDSGGNTQEFLKLQNNNEKFPSIEDLRYNYHPNLNKNNIYYFKNLNSHSWDINDLPENIKYNIPLVLYLKNDKRNLNDKFFCELIDDIFLHYRSGSNWRNEGLDFHDNMIYQLFNILMC